MSLINKMLVDLEARKEGAAIVQPIYDDLRPAIGAKPAPAFARYRFAFAAVGVGLVLATAYALLRPQPATPEPVTVVAKRAATPAPPVQSPLPAAAAPVPAPAAALSTPPAVTDEPVPSAQPSVVASVTGVPATTPSAPAPAVSSPHAAAAAPTSVTLPSAAPAPPAASNVSAATAAKAPTGAGTAMPKAEETYVPSAVAARPSEPPIRARVAERVPPTKAVNAVKPTSPTQGDTEVRIEKTARVITPRERALELHRTASAQRKRGDTHAAEASLRAALVQDADLIPARSDLVTLQMEHGRIPEALALLHDGLTRTPAHHAFAQLAARLYVEQGNDAQALAVLEATRAHAARDADYLGFLATLYQRARRYADAAVAYEAALALRPQEARWWVGSGIVREAQGDAAGAEVAYARAQGSPSLPPTLARFVHERLAALKARAS